jgi:hypothetical protein
MDRDANKKKELLNRWYQRFAAGRATCIASKGELLDKQKILSRIGEVVAGFANELSIYILLLDSGTGKVPIYVGKSDTPLIRWSNHLDGLSHGKSSYRKWKALLSNADGTVKYDLTLLVVPKSAIDEPPIPDFPTAVGAVEYQLIALASDAFPDTLLNHEGKSR